MICVLDLEDVRSVVCDGPQWHSKRNALVVVQVTRRPQSMLEARDLPHSNLSRHLQAHLDKVVEVSRLIRPRFWLISRHARISPLMHTGLRGRIIESRCMSAIAGRPTAAGPAVGQGSGRGSPDRPADGACICVLTPSSVIFMLTCVFRASLMRCPWLCVTP